MESCAPNDCAPFVVTGNFTAVVERIDVETVSGPLFFDQGGPNCASYDGSDVEKVIHGVARATWSDPGVRQANMTLWARDYLGNRTSATGPSPIIIEFEDFDVKNFLSIYLRASDGIMWDVQIEMSWSLAYVGKPDARHELQSC